VFTINSTGLGLDKTRQDNVVIGRRRMASMPLNINLTKNNCKQI